MLHGDLFVGFSRAGRVFVCSDWRKALHDQVSLAAHSSLIECETDGSSFDLGGWLSVRNHRLMFEIQDRVYIVALDNNNKIQDVDHPVRASYSLVTSSAPQLAVPISFMGIYDDAIMTTYTVRSTFSKCHNQKKESKRANIGECRPSRGVNPSPTCQAAYPHNTKALPASSRQKLSELSALPPTSPTTSLPQYRMLTRLKTQRRRAQVCQIPISIFHQPTRY